MKQYCLVLVCLFWSLDLWSSPWIGTIEKSLHQDLYTLAEWGVLDASVTSYPVPWKGIAEQLAAVDTQSLADVPRIATQRLKYYLQAHQRKQGLSILSLYASTGASRFTDFDGVQAEKAQLSVTKEWYLGRWAGQVSANHLSGGESHFDESFIAYQFGNWNLRLGALSQWWGPAQTSSLILSNNARPIPAIAFSRSQATESKSGWLKYLGPWFFTAQLGQLESKRVVPHTRLWMTRFNFKPLHGLELGLSWSAMWGGEGQPNGFKDFIDVITFRTECANGEATCDDAWDTKKGNHIAGFDFKYSLTMFNRPFSLYVQRIGEDAVDYYRITDYANLIGLSSYVLGNKIYVETSDTNIACASADSTVKNCYYEHSLYQSGYRRYNRAIGSTFDSDAKMLSVGLNRVFSNGDILELVVNRLTLNEDKQRPSPVLKGNSETLLRLAGFYQTQFGDWQIKLGANIERSEIDAAETETDAHLYTEIKYVID